MTRVLIVDDEPSIRRLIETLPTLEGFDVTTAPGDSAGLEKYWLQSPTL